MAVSTNEKNAKLGQKGHVGVTWLTFGILGPPIISGTNEVGIWGKYAPKTPKNGGE